MRAAIYKGAESIEVEDVELPILSEGEALIKVHYAGICGSDIFIYSGKHPRALPPLITGHEFSGEIVEINSFHEEGFKIGDKVVVRPTYYCGNCYPCKEGFKHVCQNLKLIGIDTHGGFAEFVKVPLDQIYKIPNQLDLKTAALVEPLAVAVHSVRNSKLKVGDTVTILGAGTIGILTGIIAKLSGAGAVYITDINEFRLKKAKSVGLSGINIMEIDPVEYVRNATDGRLSDITFDAAGVSGTAEIMTSITRIKGQIVVVGVFKKSPIVDLLSVNFKEQELVGSRVYTDRDFNIALGILSENRKIGDIITDTISLNEIKKGFETVQARGNAIKIMVKIV